MRTFNCHICKKELKWFDAISKDALKGTQTYSDEVYCGKCKYLVVNRRYLSKRQKLQSHKSFLEGGVKL